MAKEGRTAGLDGMAGALREAGRRGSPPVHLWDPPYCGEIDMRIAADGTWFYQKTPIGRAALVKLFASVLKREGDHYFLVTPVEKCGITVDDAPFLAVELAVEKADATVGRAAGPTMSRILHFRTNVDDWVTVDHDHPLRFEPDSQYGYSTFGWVIERMLTDIGFTLESVDYHAPLHGTYLLRKPKAGEQS